MTEEILTEIPNIQRGILYTLATCDSESAAAVTAELITRICGQFGTSVGYIALADNLTAIQEKCAGLKAVGTLHAVRQSNHDCRVVLRRCQGLYNRQFVRAFIIDGADTLKVPGPDGKLTDNPEAVKRQLTAFAASNKVPVITLETTSNE